MKKVLVLFLIVMVSICFLDAAYAARKKAPQQQERVVPKKVEVDTNGDGKPDRTENYDSEGMITSVEADTDGNGEIDEWLYYESGKLIKAAKDTTGDGKQNTWITY